MKIKRSLLIINTLNWLFIFITLILAQPVISGAPIKLYEKLPICTSIDLVLAFSLLIINLLVISNNKFLFKEENELNINVGITLLTLIIISILFTVICFILLFAL